jgi:hypothetical protein
MAAIAPDRTLEEIVGKTDFDFFSKEHAAAAFEDEQKIIRTGEAIVGKLERETFHNGTSPWVSTTKMPLRDERGQIIGTFGISRDVTAQIKAEKALAYQVLHDPVTGLANRAALMDRLSQALAGLERQPGRLAVLYVDLDHFKKINDSFGHEAGDQVLAEVGRRLSLLSRHADTVASAATSSSCCAGICATTMTSVSSATASFTGSVPPTSRMGGTSPSPAASGSSSPAIPSPNPTT